MVVKTLLEGFFYFYFPVERPKAVRVTSSPLKRTGSLEAIYLKGQWPSPEFLSTATFKVDACTQVTSVHHFKTRYEKRKFLSLLVDILFALFINTKWTVHICFGPYDDKSGLL